MPLHIETPLIESRPLSARLNKNVWLKMDALQPSGSFKARGIGHACETYQRRGAARFVACSGGNAGLAVAYAGRQLGLPVLVVVPVTTTERAKALIRLENAEVMVHGASFSEANAFALSLVGPNDAYIHPFDDPLLWHGHATLVDEMLRQGPKPDVVVLSVGGGGLFCGVVEGLRRNGWGDVPVVAVETAGADSLAQSLQAGCAVTLPAITSIATSLGARAVCAQSLRLAREHPVESVVVSDAAAVAGCLALLDDHRVLTEAACGASLAALHSASGLIARAQRVAVVVCGGVGVTAAQLQYWHDGFAVPSAQGAA
jgi:L-serine/L-threonine ammonia-lyase